MSSIYTEPVFTEITLRDGCVGNRREDDREVRFSFKPEWHVDEGNMKAADQYMAVAQAFSNVKGLLKENLHYDASSPKTIQTRRLGEFFAYPSADKIIPQLLGAPQQDQDFTVKMMQVAIPKDVKVPTAIVSCAYELAGKMHVLKIEVTARKIAKGEIPKDGSYRFDMDSLFRQTLTTYPEQEALMQLDEQERCILWDAKIESTLISPVVDSRPRAVQRLLRVIH